MDIIALKLHLEFVPVLEIMVIFRCDINFLPLKQQNLKFSHLILHLNMSLRTVLLHSTWLVAFILLMILHPTLRDRNVVTHTHPKVEYIGQ